MWRQSSGIWKIYLWVISTGYEGEHVINLYILIETLFIFRKSVYDNFGDELVCCNVLSVVARIWLAARRNILILHLISNKKHIIELHSPDPKRLVACLIKGSDRRLTSWSFQFTLTTKYILIQSLLPIASGTMVYTYQLQA